MNPSVVHQLHRNIWGVSESGVGRIQSTRDAALFGGYSTREMKERLGAPEKRPLADFLPREPITAKNLGAVVANLNGAAENIQGEKSIPDEHVLNNQDIRNLLIRRGIVPGSLPPEEDLLKRERPARGAKKKLADRTLQSPGNGQKQDGN